LTEKFFVGWLWKKGHVNKNWKKRWFELVIDKGIATLKYWENNAKSDLKGEQIITDDSTVIGVESIGTHRNCFKLSSKANKVELIMDAEAAHLRMKWIMALESALLDVKKLSENRGFDSEIDDVSDSRSASLVTVVEKFVRSWMESDKIAYDSLVMPGEMFLLYYIVIHAHIPSYCRCEAHCKHYDDEY
jgi:hypothetical protein